MKNNMLRWFCLGWQKKVGIQDCFGISGSFVVPYKFLDCYLKKKKKVGKWAVKGVKERKG